MNKQGERIYGTIQWSYGSRSNGSASLMMEAHEDGAYLTIGYQTKAGEIVKQQVRLLAEPGNLGNSQG